MIDYVSKRKALALVAAFQELERLATEAYPAYCRLDTSSEDYAEFAGVDVAPDGAITLRFFKAGWGGIILQERCPWSLSMIRPRWIAYVSGTPREMRGWKQTAWTMNGGNWRRCLPSTARLPRIVKPPPDLLQHGRLRRPLTNKPGNVRIGVTHMGTNGKAQRNEQPLAVLAFIGRPAGTGQRRGGWAEG